MTSRAQRSWWPWLRRLLTLAFFLLVGWLLIRGAREIEWAEVTAALRERPLASLVPAALVAAASYLVYGTYDLIGRRYSGHSLSKRRVMTIGFVSYAFNLNFGSLIGGFAFRYRLYSRYGLESDVVTRVLTMSIVSNWLGYLLLAGLVAASGAISPPAAWKVGGGALQAAGVHGGQAGRATARPAGAGRDRRAHPPRHLRRVLDALVEGPAHQGD